MDSTSDLLAAASVDQFTQSDPESGPVRRSRQRARNSDVLPIGDEPPPAVSSSFAQQTQICV